MTPDALGKVAPSTMRLLPTLQHPTTCDGVRIAFRLLGHDPAVVMLLPYHMSHVRLNWRVGLQRPRSVEAGSRIVSKSR